MLDFEDRPRVRTRSIAVDCRRQHVTAVDGRHVLSTAAVRTLFKRPRHVAQTFVAQLVWRSYV